MSVLYVVRTIITEDKQDDFNRWYNEDHVPHVLAFKGAVSARRFLTVKDPELVAAGKLANERWTHLAAYEFQDVNALGRWFASPDRKEMRADHEQRWGPIDNWKEAFVQIWP